ncbi:MAG: metallophosphoesterase [Bacteroidales bacterium]|jgi:Icc-related predicted phosphoesterase|nr:metallophosphoesterase [Bacteroidales bacterium]
MTLCFFASDLHGKVDRYEQLFKKIKLEKPVAVFLGGDLLPSGLFAFTSNPDMPEDFTEFIFKKLRELKKTLGNDYPAIFTILGNDDGRAIEEEFVKADQEGLIVYMHEKKAQFHDFTIYGYACIPPSPFMLKDWERYDVSKYIDPGCVAPEDGSFSVETDKKRIKYETIQKDLVKLCDEDDLSTSIFLFHSPPYQTKLDRAALDGKMIDYVPLDVHIGSIAIKRFIEERKPFLTLHGHVHESTVLTGYWTDQIGNTICLNAAHDGPELSLIRFTINSPEKAVRELL